MKVIKMKEKKKITLIVCVIIILMFLFVILFEIDLKDMEEKRTDICKRMEQTNLKFVAWGDCNCGDGAECVYCCQFIDLNGNIIIKNVK